MGAASLKGRNSLAVQAVYHAALHGLGIIGQGGCVYAQGPDGVKLGFSSGNWQPGHQLFCTRWAAPVRHGACELLKGVGGRWGMAYAQQLGPFLLQDIGV